MGVWIDPCGVKYWYDSDDENLLHREDGPAIEWLDGANDWYQNGKLHRINGPARTLSDGSTFWHYHGQFHRLDGPAIEYPNGVKHWVYYGKTIDCNSQKEFDRIIKLRAFW